MSIDYRTFEASHILTDSIPNMPNKIHVLLVEHESRDHDKIKNMLQYFSYEVTSVNLASTAISILSKEKVQFDLVIANMNSPDSYVFQLLQAAVKMDLLVIFMSNDDDARTTMRALEEGAFLCIKKPVTMQMLGYLWQHASREKLFRIKEKEPSTKVIKYNPQAEEFQVDLVEGNGDNAEEKHTSEHDNVVCKRKVWTEWTVELHGKFMDAARELGQGRCYPKDILELMSVPGLTRMQVASHLQKCRNAKWLPPDKRKSKQAYVETTPPENKPPKSKPVSFGSMPFVDDNSGQFHLRIQEHRQEMNHQGFAFDPSTRVESSNNVYHPQYLLDYGINPFGENNGTFNMGQLIGQTFGVDEQFVYGGQSEAPITNISSNHITEAAFELPIMDSLMVQNFSDFQLDLGMDYNGSWKSLVLDQEDNYQIPTVTNATNQWIHGALKSVDNAETEEQMREG